MPPEIISPSSQVIFERDILPGWDNGLLTLESQNPRRRFNAILNIAQNGAQTLALIAMKSDTTHEATWYQIFSSTTDLVGFQLTHKSTTKGHLKAGIEPLGAVRSRNNGVDLAITDFGIAMKPALVYMWQQFKELDINPVSLLGSNSQVKKGEKNELISSAALVRANILIRAFGREKVKGSEFLKFIPVSDTALQKHLSALMNGGFIDRKNADPNSGEPVSEFEVTQLGLQTTNWSDSKPIRSWPFSDNAVFVQQSIKELIDEGQKITYDSILSQIKTSHPITEQSEKTIRHYTIPLMVNRKLLQHIAFSGGNYLEISLTDLGESVAEHILFPLYVWSISPTAVPQINEVTTKFRNDPHSYTDLYHHVAKIFIDKSPFVNKNPEMNDSLVLSAIHTNPGLLTQAELARKLNISQQSVARVLKRLSKNLQISSLPPDPGGRVRYIPKERNKP